MSLSRFYLPPHAWPAEGPLRLEGDEAHHCARVLRRRVGDRVEVFDGAGRVATGELAAVERNAVEVRVEAVRVHEPLPHRLHLMPALVKGDAFEWLLEKAVELGAASIQPVATANGVVNLGGEAVAKKMAKWRRHMVEAAKQCHTPFVPELRPATAWTGLDWESPRAGLKLIPALSERSRRLIDAVQSWPGEREAWVLIGPEGDFTPEEEAEALAAGFQPVTLGPLILRAETAATAVLAVLAQCWAGSGFER